MMGNVFCVLKLLNKREEGLSVGCACLLVDVTDMGPCRALADAEVFLDEARAAPRGELFGHL